MKNNYVTYHLHTMLSLLDSCTDYKDHMDKAKELGQTAICITEHGNCYNWVEKKMYANSLGLKYLHGIEIYLTESLEPKIRDNYHTILIAKNTAGRNEINTLVDLASRADHFYYKPRITFEEFFNISDNVIKISACLASPLNCLPNTKKQDEDKIKEIREEIGQDAPDDGRIEELYQHINRNREIYDKLIYAYDYYEIQPHINSLEQKEYNKFLYMLSMKTGIPLIAATDTHSINQYKAECRKVLMAAKGITFTGEDEFDLTYKSYEELVEMFRMQGVLPEQVYLEAIENTNKMAEMCEDEELDTSFKYPNLYPNEDEIFVKRVYDMYHDKLDRGIITPDPRYEENIQEELRVFRKIGMVGFMLFMSELISWCWEHNVPVGFCRGSVGGSTIAYLTDIIDVNPIKWNTVFSRFCNEDRKELGDIDVDIAPDQRSFVYDHIIQRFGEDKTAYILAITTISDKGTIDEIGRALNIPLPTVKEIKDRYSSCIDAINDIKEKISTPSATEDSVEKLNSRLQNLEEELNKIKTIEYPEVFKYFDGLVGTAIAQSMHPAGIVVSPVTLTDNYGTFWARDGKRVLTINMDEIHEVNLNKYDILGLRNIAIIRDTCKLAGIPYPKSHLINWDDKDVWEHISDSPVGLFQFESPFAFDSLKHFGCKSVNDISIVTAAIRPSGTSYRDRLLNHEVNHNPSAIIDELLADNKGFLIFQEDTIKFLKNICGLSGSDADNIRRAIGRKQKDRLDAAMPQILEGYCSKSDRPRDIAEKEAEQFLQIISDSASYQFGFNHSTGYSMITYVCAYLRHHYQKEFITAYLNNANNDDDILIGTNLAMQYKIPMHPVLFRHSTANYSCDGNGIYKGITSIKYMSDSVADELYNLKDNTYESFIDVLVDVLNCKGMDSRKTDILIKLDYFQEFGDIGYLLKCYEWFDKIVGKKQFKKDKAFQYQIDFDLIRKHASKETPKMFTGIDSVGLARDIVKELQPTHTSLRQRIAYQLDLLGYIGIVDKKYRGYCVVMDVSDKYTPKITLYPLANGNTFVAKIPKKEYTKNPLACGDIIKITPEGCRKKSKMKMVNDVWVKDPEEKEWWIYDYYTIAGYDLEQ